MDRVVLRKVDNALMVPLPLFALEALQLSEDDEVAIEVVGDRVILTRVSPDFQDAWAAYQSVESRYGDANRKLAE